MHHLQALVKAVQQSGGPQLPIDDLVDLTLTLSDDPLESSACGESEEEADLDGDTEEDADGEQTEEEEDEEDDDEEEEDNEEQSEISKSTDANLNVSRCWRKRTLLWKRKCCHHLFCISQ